MKDNKNGVCFVLDICSYVWGLPWRAVGITVEDNRFPFCQQLSLVRSFADGTLCSLPSLHAQIFFWLLQSVNSYVQLPYCVWKVLFS